MSKITYRQVGDYLIPNLTLPPEEAKVTLGKWGMLYKDYLLNHKKIVFSTLLAGGKLYQHCAEVEQQANEMYDLLIEQLKVAEGVTEKLKEQNQMEWVQIMGNIEARAREVVNNEIIFKIMQSMGDEDCSKPLFDGKMWNLLYLGRERRKNKRMILITLIQKSN